MTFVEGDRDRGRVITGSSNLTQSGLIAGQRDTILNKSVSGRRVVQSTGWKTRYGKSQSHIAMMANSVGNEII